MMNLLAQILRIRCLSKLHDSHVSTLTILDLSRHPRLHLTITLISTQFYWLKMHPNIHKYVTKRYQCQVNKVERVKAAGLLHPSDIPNNKWESITMDFIVHLPCTQKTMMPFV